MQKSEARRQTRSLNDVQVITDSIKDLQNTYLADLPLPTYYCMDKLCK